MDFSLTQEQLMLISTIRTMGEREDFKSRAAEIDRSGEFPHYPAAQVCRNGTSGHDPFPGIRRPGPGSPLTAILAIEELAKFGPMLAAPVFESNVGPVRVIDLFGTPEQKAAVLPGVCRGELSVSVGMTEPEAGSDLTSLKTRLDDKGDHYLLNGRKVFISGGGEASHYPGVQPLRRHDRVQGHWSGAGGKRARRVSPSASRRSSWALGACRPAT